ncbi:MAG: hypothetical protein V1921_02200 [Candidatus Altiarchaeota archaeon]
MKADSSSTDNSEKRLNERLLVLTVSLLIVSMVVFVFDYSKSRYIKTEIQEGKIYPEYWMDSDLPGNFELVASHVQKGKVTRNSSIESDALLMIYRRRYVDEIIFGTMKIENQSTAIKSMLDSQTSEIIGISEFNEHIYLRRSDPSRITYSWINDDNILWTTSLNHLKNELDVATKFIADEFPPSTGLM